MKQWYEALFSNYAQKYENEPFTKGTLSEVDFLESEMKQIKSARILDIGCGTGRHSIELARRNFNVTGIDLSQNMLDKAMESAKKANVQVDFIKADARDFRFDKSFDIVIMLCEGGFSLMETDEMNFEILKNASKVLAPNGKFIFTCLNALYHIFHSVKELVDEGTSGVYEGKFDIMKFRDFSSYIIQDDDGKEMHLECNERYYVPSEIVFMLKQLGFTKVEIFGAEIGKYDRSVPLQTNHFEMLVIAER